MKEIWKDIVGYENIYQVSNLGRIKSLSRITIQNHLLTEKILKPSIDKDGYSLVHLCNNGKRKTFKVHRIVAFHFIYFVCHNHNLYDYYEIDHIDTIRSNNNINNLRIVSSKQNTNNPLTLKHRSECMKGKFDGENNPFYGKKHSLETKSKLSENKKGKKNPVARYTIIYDSYNNKILYESDTISNASEWLIHNGYCNTMSNSRNSIYKSIKNNKSYKGLLFEIK